jgi:hypothetical protein
VSYCASCGVPFGQAHKPDCTADDGPCPDCRVDIGQKRMLAAFEAHRKMSALMLSEWRATALRLATQNHNLLKQINGGIAPDPQVLLEHAFMKAGT